MTITPQTEDAIQRSLAWLRWQSRIAAALVGAFVGFLVGIVSASIFGTPIDASFGLSALCLVGAVFLERRSWFRWVARLHGSFICLDGDQLEIRGISRRGVFHARFRLGEVACVECGDRVMAIFPNRMVRAFSDVALVVRMKDGRAVRFEMFGVVFAHSDLAALMSELAQQMPQKVV